MIFKQEKADGTILVSGTINSYKDFKNCLAGCSEKENHGGKKIISEFVGKNGESSTTSIYLKLSRISRFKKNGKRQML